MFDDNDKMRFVLTVIAVLSIIVGFFLNKVSSDVFYATVGSIITHFYQNYKVNELKKKIDSKLTTGSDSKPKH